jgi:hypothetical protein
VSSNSRPLDKVIVPPPALRPGCWVGSGSRQCAAFGWAPHSSRRCWGLCARQTDRQSPRTASCQLVRQHMPQKGGQTVCQTDNSGMSAACMSRTSTRHNGAPSLHLGCKTVSPAPTFGLFSSSDDGGLTGSAAAPTACFPMPSLPPRPEAPSLSLASLACPQRRHKNPWSARFWAAP